MATGDFTRINTNIGALNALDSLKQINAKMGVRQLRLATGKRINEAADDPAGLTIATKFKYRASGLGVALDNIGDSKNLLSVAESGLQKINDILVQMRDKALQAASDSLGSDERTAILNQLSSYTTQIDNIVDETKWNNVGLLGGGISKTFQTGADTSETTAFTLAQNHKSTGTTLVEAVGLGVAVNASETASVTQKTSLAGISGLATASLFTGLTELTSGTYTVAVTAYTASTSATIELRDANGNVVQIDSNNTNDASNALANNVTVSLVAGAATVDLGRGISFTVAQTGGAVGSFQLTYTQAGGTVSDSTKANTYLGRVNTAVTKVSESISYIGALVSRLSFKEEAISTAKTNVEAAYNRIMNADMAYEQLESTKLQILQQTATAMLAQANTSPQGILSLFR